MQCYNYYWSPLSTGLSSPSESVQTLIFDKCCRAHAKNLVLGQDYILYDITERCNMMSQYDVIRGTLLAPQGVLHCIGVDMGTSAEVWESVQDHWTADCNHQSPDWWHLQVLCHQTGVLHPVCHLFLAAVWRPTSWGAGRRWGFDPVLSSHDGPFQNDLGRWLSILSQSKSKQSSWYM